MELKIADDGAPEPGETLHLALSVLIGDPVVGAQSNAVFTIRNGHPSIYSDSTSALEEGAPVRWEVWRRGDTNLVLSVQYATKDETAHAGDDYVGAAGTVTFAPGQLAAEIAVATLDNGRVDGQRAFLLRLSSPSPGVEVGSPEVVAVIRDNEQPVVWDRTFAPQTVSPAAAFALASDGKLVLTEVLGPPLHPVGGLRIVRWDADGALDPGFTAGYVYNGTTYSRTYARLSDVPADAVIGRIASGAHFRSACLAGLEMGQKIAVQALRDFLRPLPRLAGSPAPGEFQLRLGEAFPYVIETSANLNDWTPWQTNLYQAVPHTDPDFGAGPNRFYRAVLAEP